MNRNYLCTPRLAGKKEKILCLIFLVLAFLSFFLSSRIPHLRAAAQLLSVVLLFLFIQITTKFLLTRYQYSLEDSTLYLSTLQGTRRKSLGGIPLTSSCLLMERGEWEKRKKEFRLRSSFSYCQNLFPEKSYCLLAPETEGYVALFFEPDETLVSLIDEIIKK